MLILRLNRPDGDGSLPVRGAWIEIFLSGHGAPLDLSLPVRGAWIEISPRFRSRKARTGRSPCGERGLKYVRSFFLRGAPGSLPVRGAWIEMWMMFTPRSFFAVAPRAGSVD